MDNQFNPNEMTPLRRAALGQRDNIKAIKGVDGLIYSPYTDTQACLLPENPKGWTAANAPKGDLTIPAKIEFEGKEYTIDCIGFCAFIGCAEITSVTLPSTIKSIGALAFAGCVGLQQIKLNKGLMVIEGNAFQDCIGLKQVQLPDTMYAIGSASFINCANLQSIHFNNGLHYLANAAFVHCAALTQIELPDTLAEIPEAAFGACTQLQKVKLPAQLNVLGMNAFGEDEKITEIELPDTLKYLSGLNGTGIQQISLPKNLQRIGTRAFEGCTQLTDLQLPESVINIDPYAFNGCSHLTHIFIPDSVKGFAPAMLNGCEKLEKIDWGFPLFVSEGLIYEYLKDNDVALSGYLKAPQGSLEVPATRVHNQKMVYVTAIKDAALSDCEKLTSINVPDQIIYMGKASLDNCDQLSTINWNAGQGMIQKDGLLYKPTGNGEVSLFLCLKSPTGKFALPATIEHKGQTYSVTAIEKYALSESLALEDLEIPDSIKSIGTYAFAQCNRLQHVQLSEGKQISKTAFWGCNALPQLNQYKYPKE